MNEPTKDKWFLAATLAAVTLVPTGIVSAVFVGASGPDPADTYPPRVSVAQSPSGVATEAMSAPVIVRSPPDMIQQHHAMMDQMRSSVSATMNELMNSDPMWQMMRSSALIADLERHEQDIDRMLGRGG